MHYAAYQVAARSPSSSAAGMGSRGGSFAVLCPSRHPATPGAPPALEDSTKLARMPRRSGERVREAGVRGVVRLHQPLIRPSATFSPLRRGEGSRQSERGSRHRPLLTSSLEYRHNLRSSPFQHLSIISSQSLRFVFLKSKITWTFDQSSFTGRCTNRKTSPAMDGHSSPWLAVPTWESRVSSTLS